MLLPLLLLFGGGLLVGPSAKPKPDDPGSWPPPGDDETDPDDLPDSPDSPDSPSKADRLAMRAWIVEAAQHLEWPGLDRYLTVCGYTESRYNPMAAAPGATSTNNVARGLFGMRPQYALLAPLSYSQGSDQLYSPEISVACAADLAWRLKKYRKKIPTSQLDWAAIRRGWALPYLVADQLYTKERSRDVLGRLEEAEEATGVSVQGVPAYPDGYKWPGLQWGLERLGVKP